MSIAEKRSECLVSCNRLIMKCCGSIRFEHVLSSRICWALCVTSVNLHWIHIFQFITSVVDTSASLSASRAASRLQAFNEDGFNAVPTFNSYHSIEQLGAICNMKVVLLADENIPQDNGNPVMFGRPHRVRLKRCKNQEHPYFHIQGLDSIYRYLAIIGNPIVEMRQSRSLISTMGFPILLRHISIELGREFIDDVYYLLSEIAIMTELSKHRENSPITQSAPEPI